MLSVLLVFGVSPMIGTGGRRLERVTEGSYRDSRAGVGAAFLFSPTRKFSELLVLVLMGRT